MFSCFQTLSTLLQKHTFETTSLYIRILAVGVAGCGYEISGGCTNTSGNADGNASVARATTAYADNIPQSSHILEYFSLIM